MLRFAWPILLVLTGCVGLQRDYGKIYPVDTTIPTACASVVAFHESLRAAPGEHSPDSFMGYLDFMRSTVYLIAPVSTTPATQIGPLLQSTDPRKHAFWLEARITDGRLAEGETFEALVPPKQHKPDAMTTIVEREAILVRGTLHAACGKQYLVAVQATPYATEDTQWPIIRRDYDQFASHVRWPAQ